MMPLCTCVCLCVCVCARAGALIFGVLCRETGAAFILENELEIPGTFGYPQFPFDRLCKSLRLNRGISNLKGSAGIT